MTPLDGGPPIKPTPLDPRGIGVATRTPEQVPPPPGVSQEEWNALPISQRITVSYDHYRATWRDDD